jgi:outer membrane protein OmpU
MNKQKGEKMNKFKKIGLTALAGSLVAVSANAIELSVSGATSVSYTSSSTKTAAAGAQGPGGQAIGVDTGIYFNGSGELENGWTVSTFAAFDDGRALGLSSSQLTLGMGSLGSVVFAQSFGTAANGIDDMTPRVKEEAFDQAGGSVLHSFGRSTTEGAVTYKSPSIDMAGLSLSFGVDYDPAAGNGFRHGTYFRCWY